jgi:DUF438 domain-containing protein
MIYKEEKILFPTALDLLTEQDWYDIYIQSDEIGYCIFVPEFEWQPTGGIHKDIKKSTAASNRIQMPTGSFTLEEIISAFTSMPFDLTFVDKDDTVRYFSPGKDRIFDRTRAILGRKVQYCHPPKSVHIVNQIIADFKSGKQDKARFWIQMGPKFVYIVYLIGNSVFRFVYTQSFEHHLYKRCEFDWISTIHSLRHSGSCYFTSYIFIVTCETQYQIFFNRFSTWSLVYLLFFLY